MTIDHTLDTSGLECPLPILKAKVQLAKMQAGQVLQVIATDPHAPIDFKAYCARSGDEFLDLQEGDESLTMLLRKKG